MYKQEVEKHLGLAEHHARFYSVRYKANYDELLSDGYWGLVLAGLGYKEDKGAKFSTYARRRVKGKIKDRFRKKARRKHPYEERAIVDEDLVEVRTPQSLLIREEKKRQLRLVLLKINSRQRAILWLYYYGELTLKEIGELLGISEGGASMLKRAAYKNLRKALEDEDPKNR